MSALTQIQIRDIVDQVMCDVTQRIGGAPLQRWDGALSGDICTVRTVFEGGFEGSLTLCAQTALLVRLTRIFLQEESVSGQDVEDFTKEYLNIICGQVVAKLFQQAHVSARFQIPIFLAGRHEPAQLGAQRCVLSYFNGCNECAQLIHQLSSV